MSEMDAFMDTKFNKKFAIVRVHTRVRTDSDDIPLYTDIEVADYNTVVDLKRRSIEEFNQQLLQNDNLNLMSFENRDLNRF